jgi:hypothetical protein
MKKYFYFLIIIITLFSCETSPDEITNKSDTVRVEIPAKPKMFHGEPDLPENDRQITSAGIGKILLGDSLNKINYNYDSIINIYVQNDGRNWPAKKILFNNKSWIIAESVNSVNQITGIRTNNPDFFTKENYHVGMNTDSIHWKKDSIAIDEEKRIFLLYEESIWFRIDSTSEKIFFNMKEPDLENLKNSTIEEIFIICGDC